jgi:hypothetical protein
MQHTLLTNVFHSCRGLLCNAINCSNYAKERQAIPHVEGCVLLAYLNKSIRTWKIFFRLLPMLLECLKPSSIVRQLYVRELCFALGPPLIWIDIITESDSEQNLSVLIKSDEYLVLMM